MTLYFAYGSNMDERQMAKRCPTAKLVGKAWLPGYRLFINQRGYANVLPARGAQTIGLLWELTAEEEATLDLHEGCHKGIYKKCYCTVTDEAEKELEALVYIDKKNRSFGYPKHDYIERITTAAKKHAFPEYYQAMLQFWCDKQIRKDLNRFYHWLRSTNAKESFTYMSSKSKATEEWRKTCPQDPRIDGHDWLKKNHKKLVLNAMTLFESQVHASTTDLKRAFFELVLETLSNRAVDKIDRLIRKERQELNNKVNVVKRFIKQTDELSESTELQKIIELAQDKERRGEELAGLNVIITTDLDRIHGPRDRFIVTEHAPAISQLWHRVFWPENVERLSSDDERWVHPRDARFMEAFADATEASLNESTETVLRNILKEVKKTAEGLIEDLEREDDRLSWYTDPEDEDDDF